MSADMQDIIARMQSQIGNIPAVEDLPEPEPPACETCQDTGYVRYDVPYTHPMFGKMYHCPELNCPTAANHRRQQVEIVMKHSTWNDGYTRMTFESFWNLCDEKNAWDGKRGAYSAASMFARCDGQPFTLNEASMHVLQRKWPEVIDGVSNSVVLTGDVGLGKTGLAVAAANLLRELDKNVVFIRLMDLVRTVQETYRQSTHSDKEQQIDTTSDVYRFFNSVTFLILDEFGIKNYTQDRREIVETIIRARDRAGLPTLYTTNLTKEEISDGELWDKQIGDIVQKAHWVKVGGVKLRDTQQKVATW